MPAGADSESARTRESARSDRIAGRVAQAAGLTDLDEVIGVQRGGRFRAYAIRALTHLARHVVNDEFNGKPVTVTYCDRTNCAQVFTDPSHDTPLNVAVGGWDDRPDGGLLLRVGPDRFYQTTGRPLHDGDATLPYEPMPFVRTRWKQWREEHPDTDVYIGDPTAEEVPDVD